MAPNVFDRVYTREELEAQADKLARESSLRMSGPDAWAQVRQGKLEGTMFASKLARLFFLIESCEPTLNAAE